jgi:hypothetical protein
MEGTEEGFARRWEEGSYKKIVTISRHEQFEMNEEAVGQSRQNQEEIATGEVEICLIEFLGGNAIESTLPVEDGELKYLMFNAGDSTYHFSVQGDTSDYETIKASIKIYRGEKRSARHE